MVHADETVGGETPAAPEVRTRNVTLMLMMCLGFYKCLNEEEAESRGRLC